MLIAVEIDTAAYTSKLPTLQISSITYFRFLRIICLSLWALLRLYPVSAQALTNQIFSDVHIIMFYIICLLMYFQIKRVVCVQQEISYEHNHFGS